MSSLAEPSTLPLANRNDAVYYYASRTLLGIVWASCALFGLYILAHYAAAWSDGDLERWNAVLPEIYLSDEPAASVGIGLHFAAGGLILLLGGIQLLETLRLRFPTVHRWTGRVYVTVSLIAAIGGLSFIAIRGTVGGPVMDVGFGLYGLLTALAAVQTIRYGMLRQFQVHQAWAWRLYALAIGSWLYRMDYGLWLLLTDWIGHTDDFRGWFDRFMAFFFYVPNLLLVELIIRMRDSEASPGLRALASVSMVLACGILITATWGFARVAWIPAITAWLTS